MQLSIIYIINNKLHTFKYLNYTIIFYIILFYTYYSLLVYLLNKNYTMLILYFMFFILVYSFYKNFTYFIGFAFLIIFKIFNIDNAVNNNKLLEGASNIDKLMKKIDAKAKAKENELKKNSNDNDPPNNPCKTYIVSKVQEAGIPITAPGGNIGANTQSTPSADATRADINSKWSGMDELEAPSFKLFA